MSSTQRDNEHDPSFRRTLRVVASVAAQRAFPGRVMYGGHPIDGAYLFAFREGDAPTEAEGKLLEAAMLELIEADAELTLRALPYADAIAYFVAHDMDASASLLRSRVRGTVQCVDVRGMLRLSLFPLLASAGLLAAARPWVHVAREGLLVVYHPAPFVPSPTLLASFTDHRAWGRVHGAQTLGALNALKGVGREVVDFNLHAEFRQEAKLAAIAEAIRARNEAAESASHAVGVICIAGPTSSGKTTFATKLAMYLSNFGYHAVALSVDHYYLPLDRQPQYQLRSDRSDVDYDSIDAMDVVLVNEHVNALLAGEEVMTPVYNMKTGYRDEPGKAFKLPPTGKAILVRAAARAEAIQRTHLAPRVARARVRRAGTRVAGARGHPLTQPSVHLDGLRRAPLPYIHLPPLRAAARRGEHDAHDGPPTAPAHVPRLPLPRVPGEPHTCRVGQGACRRASLDLPAPGWRLSLIHI